MSTTSRARRTRSPRSWGRCCPAWPASFRRSSRPPRRASQSARATGPAKGRGSRADAQLHVTSSSVTAEPADALPYGEKRTSRHAGVGRAWRDVACEDGVMAQGGELSALGDAFGSEPGFDVVVRGYKRDQVDRHLSAIEAENAALIVERDEMVEQIQALAEEQAEAIRAGAAQEIADLRGQAERMLADANERTSHAERDFEIALAARRKDEERASAEERASVRAEVAEAQRL